MDDMRGGRFGLTQRTVWRPESGVITQVLGRSYRDHEETRTYVRRELSEYLERSV